MGRDDVVEQLDLPRLAVALLVPAVVITALQTWAPANEPALAASASQRGLEEAEETSQPTTTQPPSSITIAVSGELLPHPSIVEYARRDGVGTGQDYDFAPLFADLRPAVAAADAAICHLEVPVAPDDSKLSGYPDFGIPDEIAAGIAATGWDSCSTASNHVNDKGTAGIVATLDALDAAGVRHSGTARTPAEAAATPSMSVAGVKVAHLAYTWGFNGVPPREPWMADVIDPERILTDARVARAEGAELVVVSLHWGVEYDTWGSSDQRALADQLLASADVDLLVGHGPHVLQPIETFHGKYALLSVGNIVANQGRDRPRTYDGAIVTVEFTAGGDGSMSPGDLDVQPTWYDRSAGRVRLVDDALVTSTSADLRAELEASRKRTGEVLPLPTP